MLHKSFMPKEMIRIIFITNWMIKWLKLNESYNKVFTWLKVKLSLFLREQSFYWFDHLQLSASKKLPIPWSVSPLHLLLRMLSHRLLQRQKAEFSGPYLDRDTSEKTYLLKSESKLLTSAELCLINIQAMSRFVYWIHIQ